MNIGELKQRQGLPLELKIRKSIRTIEEYYNMYDGNVYLSKGGADSNVLAWLIQQSNVKDIESVCVATVEPPENVIHNKNLGDTLLKSEITQKAVIQKYGYPLISKEVAMSLSRYLHTKHDWVKDRRLHGYMGRNGKKITQGMIPKKYHFMIYAPFEVTEKCCDVSKKKPLKKYEKESHKVAITGELADESFNRKMQYLKHGCIMTDKKKVKCTPLGFWTEQDIKECIYKHNIKIPSCYGEVVFEDGQYKYTGEQRTGCAICGFGLMFSRKRLDLMQEKRPNQYKYMMNGGQWVRKPLYRWVKFRPESMPIWSNLYWIPSDEGYGYKYPLNYIFKSLGMELIE